MVSLHQPLRRIFRGLWRQPAYTVLVLSTLAVGIGVSTAIISVANAVLFRPLPYADPDRLVFIWNQLSKTSVDKSAIAPPDFVDYGERTTLFEGFAAIYTVNRALTEEGGRPEPIKLALATDNFFSLLGTELLLGEMFGPEDEGRLDPQAIRDPDAEMPTAPVILSWGLWQRRYGGDPGVLGRSVVINGQVMFIRGVAPRGFRLHLPADSFLPEGIDAWTPFPVALRAGGRTTQWLTVFARLKPGVRLVDAQAEMDAVAAWQREHFEFHKNAGMEIRVIPMHQDVTGHVRSYLVWLTVAGGLLLVLSIFNVANLMLLRRWRQRREISIRAAMGGRPGRLAGEVLIESTLLAVAGGALGLLVARWGIRLLLLLQPENLPRIEEADAGWTVLAVALGMVLLVAVGCGLLSAFQSVRLDVAATLSERSATGSVGYQRLRGGLVIAEIAISLVLLINTGLLLRSFAELSRIDPGFQAENVLAVEVGLPNFRYRMIEERADFFHELGQRLAELPGVESGSGIHPPPLGENVHAWWGPWATEEMNPEEWSENEADFRQVLPGYFETMGIPLLRGRTFTRADNERDAPFTAIVDELFARRAWPEAEDPVGKRLLIWQFSLTGGDLRATWATVVGVVAPVRDAALVRDSRGTVYGPERFYGSPNLSLMLRSATSDPMNLVAPLRELLREMDPDVPLMTVHLMQDFIDEDLAPTRFALSLIAVFTAIATLLAGVGLYGVISSAVQQRTHEIGVRMAMGAQRGDILGMVLRHSLMLTLGGLVIGLIGAFFLARGLSSLLYAVKSTDPLTFAIIPLVQVGIALLASFVPARYATKINPVEVLHVE